MPGKVLFESGDDLSEGNIAEWLPPEGNKNYFSGGASVTPNYSGNEVTVAAGKGHVANSTGIFTFKPPQKTLTLPAPSGTNYIYGRFDPTTDDSAEWVITDTQGSPPDPKVLKSTVDASAQTETLESESPDVTFGTVGADVVNADQLNNTEINLTSLVEDGTYGDIGDAIAQEPATHPQGTVFIIERGTYSISGIKSISWGNRHIKAAGFNGPAGNVWNPDSDTQPVVIECDTNPAFSIDADSTLHKGGSITGIEFTEASGSSVPVGLRFNPTNGGQIDNWWFIGCVWDGFSGAGISNAGGNQTFNVTFRACGIRGHSAEATFPAQTYWDHDCYIEAVNSTADKGSAYFDEKSYVGGTIGGTNANGVRVDKWCVVDAKNFELSSTSGSDVAVFVDGGNEEVFVGGHLDSWNTAVKLLSGYAAIDASRFDLNIGTWVHFVGAAQAHAKTIGWGFEKNKTEMDNTQSVYLWVRHIQGAANVADWDEGNVGWAFDVDGAGTPGLVYNVPGVTGVHYWAPDGTL